MAEKGIPAFVDKSGREWSPEAYVNMDIRATVKNTALDAQFEVMDKFEQDVFEVSSHPGSRPKCRPWQGKLISRSGRTTEITDINGKKYKVIPLSQTSFGEPDGLFGINCGHRPRGVSDGLFRKSSVEYDDEEDKELYNKVCRQRELERKVRKSKTEADMLEAAGDTEGAKEVRRKMAEQNKALKSYCDNNGLKYRSDRVRTYGSVKPSPSKQEVGTNHMSAISLSDWREAKPIKHTKKELDELHEFARSNNIHFIEPTKFDDDIELCKEQITVMNRLISDLNIKGKISLGYSAMPSNDMGLTSKNNRTIFINKLAGRNRQLTNSILNADKQLSPTDAVGIGVHEIGHVWVAQFGSRGIDIAQKAYYNIYKDNISTLDILDYLEENISLYSTQIKKSANPKWFKQSNYSEIIPEVLAANVTKPTEFTSEFVRLMKEVSAHDKT